MNIFKKINKTLGFRPKRKKPKICLVFCGGTIAMVRDKTTRALKPAKSVKQLLSIVPEIKGFADIDYVFVANIDSTNIQTYHWTKIAKTINERYLKYDGFVVTHGTDTMAYTASALALALQNLNKPIVITGSQMPPDDLGSDARNNLINAFRVASMDIAEVVICFGSSILRGIRAQKWSEFDLSAFHSPLSPQLGAIGQDIELTPFAKRRYEGGSAPLIYQPNFEKGIIEIRLFASLNPEMIRVMIDSGHCKGLIFQSYGAGNIPTKENSLLPLMDYAINKKGIPVLISTQCAKGKVRVGLYETGYQAFKIGAIPTRDMSLEGAIVKLSWCLAQTKDISKIRNMMSTNYVGEVSITNNPKLHHNSY